MSKLVNYFGWVIFLSHPLIATPAIECENDVSMETEDREVHLHPEDFKYPKTISIRDDCHNFPENPEEVGDKFEGDMAGIKTPRPNPGDSTDSISKQYNAINEGRYHWPSGVVPYTISSRFRPDARRVIANAIQEYSVRTCIKFEPRHGEEEDYIHFQSNKRGCWSYVGRSSGKQEINLGNGCIRKGIIIHEIMHAIGFFHEQGRNDRDDWVKIVWRNIRRGTASNFEKHGLGRITHLGTEYDYKSIMHYSGKAFSKNGKPTIVALREGGEHIGQRHALSQNDVVKINKLYNCTIPTASCIDETAYCAFTHLRDCQNPLGYQGEKSTTVSGKMCQSWNVDTPHNHTFHVVGDHNYCRNPDGETGGPWCYTTDPSKRWELCFAKCAKCVDDCLNCSYSGQRQCQDIRGYSGEKSMTKSGWTCQQWSLDVPHEHSFNDLGQHNFCRNPDNQLGPWCFTTDNSTIWEYCFEDC